MIVFGLIIFALISLCSLFMVFVSIYLIRREKTIFSKIISILCSIWFIFIFIVSSIEFIHKMLLIINKI
jgi:hypothetical protein